MTFVLIISNTITASLSRPLSSSLPATGSITPPRPLPQTHTPPPFLNTTSIRRSDTTPYLQLWGL